MHKPCVAEGSLREPKQVHTRPATQRPAGGAETSAHSPAKQRAGLGAETSAHKPATQRMNLAGLREANISGGRSRRIHTGTYLASFSQQRRAGWGTEAQAMIPRTSRGLAALQLC